MSEKPISLVWIVIGGLLALAIAFYAWPAILSIVALYYVYKSFKERPDTKGYRALFLGLGAVVLVGGAAVQIPWSYNIHNSGSKASSQTASEAGSSPASTRPSKATFSVRVPSASPASTRMAVAQVVVTNTSNVAGVPYCSVKLRDSTGTFKGRDLFEFPSVAPGATETFNAEIIVENEGAAYVAIGEADCTG